MQVVLPLRLEWEPCYVAYGSHSRGDRVRVRFAGKEYIGVVHRTGVQPDIDPSRILGIMGEAEGYPKISENELLLWEFAAEYYMCTIGEVYKAACPQVKLASEAVAGREAQRLRDRIARLDAELERRGASKRASADVTGRIAGERDELMARLHAILESPEPGTAGREAAPVARSAAPRPEVIVSPDRVKFYVEAIQQALSAGRSVLVLAPDIVFCEQMEAALLPFFPSLVTFNSKKASAARRRVADAARKPGSMVLGTRSAVFLPFSRLGLVIVDNEQDPSYKQDEPAPRYNGRDLAVKLASIHGARAIIGSASPSLETVLNCRSGKYAVLAGDASRPAQAVVIDINEERRKNGMQGPFSRKLSDAVNACSGKVTFIRGWEKADELEAQARELYPGREMEVKTCMEARRDGLSDSALAAVLQADAFADREDFRSDEHTLLTLRMLQELCPGKFVVQTGCADSVVFRALSGAGEDASAAMLQERESFGYPPYSRMVDIIFTDSNQARKGALSQALARSLSGSFRVQGVMGDRIRVILAKDRSLTARKAALSQAVSSFEKQRNYTGHIHLDADPI